MLSNIYKIKIKNKKEKKEKLIIIHKSVFLKSMKLILSIIIVNILFVNF